MTGHLRVILALARPSVVILLGLFAEVGLSVTGQGENRALVAEVLVVVVGFLLTSVLVNDLADEKIDRVNLPGDPSRPLVAGSSSRREFVVMSVAAATIALATSALLGWAAVLVVALGLALSLSYSLRPVRLADRGALASLLLPLGYVAVPYLVGILAGRGSIRAHDLVLLAGLYVGFIGRILLKDFRDVKGDALFGKRTFLVRHGRRRTCLTSAACWVLGTTALAGVEGRTTMLSLLYVGYVALALGLLRALSVDRGARRDESLIAAIAIVGRGMVVTLLAHLSMTHAGWARVPMLYMLVSITALFVGQVVTMVRVGPRSRLTVPPEWLVVDAPVVDTPAAVTAGRR